MLDYSALIQKATNWFDSDQRPPDMAASATPTGIEVEAPLSQVGFDGAVPTVDTFSFAAASKTGVGQ